ncbi:STAS domain-containing protein [Rhizobium sp. CRIBSB]|nr:STAS domain-containing protein [Rhizobium sp. CRIBSB]
MGAVRSIALPERMDASALSAIQAEIMGCRGGDLDLDASRVGRFGGLAQQLVLSAFKTWRTDGCRLRLVDPTPAVRDAFDALGCSPHIETYEPKA